MPLVPMGLVQGHACMDAELLHAPGLNQVSVAFASLLHSSRWIGLYILMCYCYMLRGKCEIISVKFYGCTRLPVGWWACIANVYVFADVIESSP